MKISLETTKNIQKVSLFFFIGIGLLHILSGLFIANGHFKEHSIIINRILDLPFLITALLYGASSIKINLQSESEKTDNTIIITCIVLILIAFYINFFVPEISS